MKTAVLGAGIAGLSAAIALKKAGYDVIVYEKNPSLNKEGTGFILSANALEAINILGLKNQLQNSSHALSGLEIRSAEGKILSRMAVKSNAISRRSLQKILLDYLNIPIVYNKEAVTFTQSSEKVTIHFQDGQTQDLDFLIAADGINSKIRAMLYPSAEKNYAGYTCWRAIVNLPLEISCNAVTTWGPKGRFGIVPLSGSKAYWFASINSEPVHNIQTIDNHKTILESAFGNYHASIPDIIFRTANEAIMQNNIYDLKPINKFAFSRILLVGDAAHASTPNIGQGASQALEDAAVLHQILKEPVSMQERFLLFERRRLRRVHFISRISRKIGLIGQLENKILISIRNSILRIIPKKAQEYQLKKIYLFKP